MLVPPISLPIMIFDRIDSGSTESICTDAFEIDVTGFKKGYEGFHRITTPAIVLSKIYRTYKSNLKAAEYAYIVNFAQNYFLTPFVFRMVREVM